MKKNITLIIACLLLIIAVCKKDKNNPGPGEKPGLTFTKGAYTSYEVAILQADNDFQTGTVNATIDGNNVSLSLLDSNRLCLLMPSLSPGQHELILEPGIFNNNTLSFTINSYTPAENPEQTINGYMDDFDESIRQLQSLKDDEGIGISAENISELKAVRQALSDALSAASQEEKNALAQFIVSNNLTIQPMNAFPYQDSFYAKAAVDPGDELMALGQTFVITTLSAAGIISAYVACASVPDPGITKIMALAAGGSALAVIIYARNVLVERLVHCVGKASDFILDGLKKTTETPIAVSAGGTMPLPDNMKFRNLQESDLSEGNYIQTIAGKIITFAGYWDQLQAALAKLKSWFSGVPEKLSGNPVQFAEAAYTTFEAKQEYLSVDNVSDNRIQLSVVNEQGENRIKATATETIDEETPFSFDITYKHPELGNSVTKTVQAVLKDGNMLDEIIAYGPKWRSTTPQSNSAGSAEPAYIILEFKPIMDGASRVPVLYERASDGYVMNFFNTLCVTDGGDKLLSCDDNKIIADVIITPNQLVLNNIQNVHGLFYGDLVFEPYQ